MLVALPPATPVSTATHLVYRHMGLVTARGTILSCSAKRGGVAEEFVQDFSMGRPWRVEAAPSDLPWWRVLQRAQEFSDRPYHLTDWNCETFVNACYGLPARSKQAEATMLVVGLGVLAFATYQVQLRG
jgi:hypothetical protein